MTLQPDTTKTNEREARRAQAHTLAMLALQSDRYVQDLEYREATDRVLDWSFPRLISRVPNKEAP